jgi:hypothetical protein
MKTFYDAWYRFGTPPWVGPHGESGLPSWPRGWAAYLMTRR